MVLYAARRLQKLLNGARVGIEGLYAASSGSLSGFSKMNLASTSPQSAHWKYWYSFAVPATGCYQEVGLFASVTVSPTPSH